MGIFTIRLEPTRQADDTTTQYVYTSKPMDVDHNTRGGRLILRSIATEFTAPNHGYYGGALWCSWFEPDKVRYRHFDADGNSLRNESAVDLGWNVYDASARVDMHTLLSDTQDLRHRPFQVVLNGQRQVSTGTLFRGLTQDYTGVHEEPRVRPGGIPPRASVTGTHYTNGEIGPQALILTFEYNESFVDF